MPTSAFNKFNSFTEAIAEKVHNLGADSLKIALCNAANAPVVGNSQLSNLTPIANTNVVTTPNANLSLGAPTSSGQTGGVYKLVLTDITITATGGSVAPFRYVVVYNDTATNKELIGWYDYGTDLTLGVGESLLVDLDQANGVLTLT